MSCIALSLSHYYCIKCMDFFYFRLATSSDINNDHLVDNPAYSSVTAGGVWSTELNPSYASILSSELLIAY